MGNFLSKFATDKFRWWALVFLSLGLAIVIIDNTVLNVAIPYILRDFNTSFDSIQWVVSGYALIIATVLITAGRLGDLIGRKKVFILGCICFAIGSFIASISPNVVILFLGEALIEAIGAAMMMTSSLSLLVSEFHGKERAIAFGVWGSVAGASAAIGPLLGGYLTTYYSWRWSLRINLLVALIAIAGSIFIQESKGEGETAFDWIGTFLSGFGLFALVFGFIEGQTYGWWSVSQKFNILGWDWPFHSISIIPISFFISIILLSAFVLWELKIERAGRAPLLRMSMFKNIGFSTGMITLGILSLGQFGTFFVLPIFLQVVLGMDAFTTGIVFLPASIAILAAGSLSGFLSAKIGPKWIVSIGMAILALGTLMLSLVLKVGESGWTLAPSLIVLGIGVGATSAQLTNIILSAVPVQLAGEASAANSTIRQVGSSIGIAILGLVLSTNITNYTTYRISSDWNVPNQIQAPILSSLQKVSLESGEKPKQSQQVPTVIQTSVQKDVNNAMTDASKGTMRVGLLFVIAGALLSLLIPSQSAHSQPWKQQSEPQSTEEVDHTEEHTLSPETPIPVA